ncbi:MAG: thiamine pyrophosphokinase [Streblomastix strix]|uniref:Thiamine pyrophosphokinase n=1 Tax=Streblomastix strix TaxID=222440 RepID=A0A5J4V4Y2_9EUKA|nr:MAG: thiamine pyrophosphokinase [Streblomastix strix]
MAALSLDEVLTDYALLILNFDLPSFSIDLIKKAKIILCADGGINHFHKLIQKYPRDIMDIQCVSPYAVVGDFDSISQDIIKFYEKCGTIIHKDENQDTNDLEKLLHFINTQSSDPLSNVSSIHNIIIIGALGGRFDHEMANISAVVACSLDQKMFL